MGRVRSVRPGWLWIELSLLVALCLVIGDRELPRLVMLSSDPDTHAYFARQLELGGGVPWGGANAFHYPMGTAVLGFLWAKLSFLDVRNAVTALPVLQAFLAALVLAEAFALRVRANAPVLLLFLTGLGATAAGFLIPLYSNYAHMQGAGRQMAMATFALIPALLIARRNATAFSMATLTLLSLFVLVVLNPINLVLPLVLLAGYLLHRALQTGQLGWGAVVPVALVPLLLVDPFYFELVTMADAPEARFTLDAALQTKPVALVFSQWRSALAVGPLQFLVGNTRFLPAQAPVFIAMVAILLPLLWWLRRWPLRRVGQYAVVAVFVLASLWAADALFHSVVDDRRFYLLAPYYWLSLAQAKILLVTTLLLAVSLELLRRRWAFIVPIAFSAVAIAGTAVAMHRTQTFMENPRVDYCGSLGCIETDDLAVLGEFEALYRDGKLRPGRVLLPNSRHSAHREKWIFPITAARAVPFFAMPPTAFFYYQGDADYTTANYMIHVCDRFDRQWLREQDVAYIFLPARRAAACMDGMESLVRSLPVLVQHGESMIVELR